MLQEEKKNLPKSEVEFIENPRGYFYKEKELQGITGIIKEYFFKDMYSDIPEHILESAAKRGTDIHNDCITYDFFQTIERDEVEWYANIVKDYEVLDSEYLVTDKENFASAIDKVLLKDNKFYLADIKTTYKLDKDYLRWQLSVLKYLFEFQTGIKVAGLLAIWLREGGKLEQIEEIDQEIIKTFLYAAAHNEPFENPFVKTDTDLIATRLVSEIGEITKEIKRLQDLESEFRSKVEKLFEDYGVEVWETDLFKISYSKAYERELFDSKKFKEENPDLFEKYKKTSRVKQSVKIKIK